MKLISIILILISIGKFTHAQTKLAYSVTPWLDNKRGAISLTFDDNIIGQYNTALPIMNDSKYSFRGTLFTITGSVKQSGVGSWTFLRDEVAAKGHEVASHTVTHRNLSQLSDKDITDEIVNSDLDIENNIPKVKCVTIAWPYGVGGDNAKVILESNKRYIGGRNAWGAEWTNGDPHDAWLKSLTYNMNVLALGINPSVTIDKYVSYITGSLQYKWLVFMYHGIDAGEYDGPGRDNFIKQMDAINAKKQNLWIAPFGEVMRYNAEKFAQKLTVISESDTEWILSLTDTLKDNEVYNHPLTLKIQDPLWKIDSISQKGKKISHSILSNFIYVNAVPDEGSIIFHKNKITANEAINNSSNKFALFPNPAKNELFITNINGIDSYIITNSSGSKVQVGTVKQDYINIEKLKSGVYMINFKSNLGDVSRKFVKE